MRHPWRSRGALITAALPVGSFETESFQEVLGRVSGEEWCEGGLWIVGSKLPFCERVVFGRDGPPVDVPRAVAASCAVPGLFVPVEIDGERYVDGGVQSPTNADLVADGGFDEVLVLSPMSTNSAWIHGRPADPMRLLRRALLTSEARKVRRTGCKVTLCQPGASEQRSMGRDPLDAERCSAIAELARRKTLERLELSGSAFGGLRTRPRA